jgi:hypothetical protein
MAVKTTRVGQRYTTTRLTIPLYLLPTARAICAGVVLLIVLAAFVLDAVQRPAQAVQEPQPIMMRPQIVYLIITATPLPPAPTAAPAVMAAPPTAEPVIIYEPIYIEVPVETMPTYAPPTTAPAVIGEVISWDGEVQQIAP